MPNTNDLSIRAMRFTGSTESAVSILEWVKNGNGTAFIRTPDAELLSSINVAPSLLVETPEGFKVMPKNWWIFHLADGKFRISSTRTSDNSPNLENVDRGQLMDLGVVELPKDTKRATIILPLDIGKHTHVWGTWLEIKKHTALPVKFFKRDCEECRESTFLEVFPEVAQPFVENEDI